VADNAKSGERNMARNDAGDNGTGGNAGFILK
jgi:hypothetical protein